MRALSIRQPYAELIVRGDKRIETRGWRTLQPDRRIWIHAGVGRPDFFGRDLATARNLDTMGGDPLTYGALIGYATFMGCIRVEDVRDSITAAEREAGDFSDGRWGWLLVDPVRVEPIPRMGRLGLWETGLEPDQAVTASR